MQSCHTGCCSNGWLLVVMSQHQMQRMMTHQAVLQRQGLGGIRSLRLRRGRLKRSSSRGRRDREQQAGLMLLLVLRCCSCCRGINPPLSPSLCVHHCLA